ncbi:MAG: translation initiation factor IF-2 [Firmicutes bacterium]|nr:translation initiation factor IF-2 [Candidatus Alectryobacillus merdavium]
MGKKINKSERIENIVSSKQQEGKKIRIDNNSLTYSGSISVGELATALNIKASDIIKKYFFKGLMLTINSPLDDNIIAEICIENNLDFNKEEKISNDNFEDLFRIKENPGDLVERAPVVTVMGHVDHGKTTLIDAIRNSRLVDSEFGGISQEIGAYQKEINGKKITFIDTPGHEAFTAMRSRGASVTDIVVLIVAADDGVMPQTIEAIDHAKAANVPIIVAINKIDAPGANSEKVISELMKYNIIPEKYGGENIFCEISAKKNIGIDNLLENILLEAEMLELKANPNRYALGTVLEARLDKGEGPKATFLIQNGTLKVGDYVIVGTTYGKIRRMSDDLNRIVSEALPSTPVSVIGLNEVPVAGDRFVALSDEKIAKDIANFRKLKKDEENRKSSITTSITDEEGNEIKNINIIIKANSTGAAEAVKGSVLKLNIPGTKINIIRAFAGAITESDVLLANASKAIIYGFNVRPDANVRNKAIEEKVEIRLHRIIYALIEELEATLKGMRKKKEVEQYLGQAEVRQTFKASKIGTIAGCYVIDGEITSTSLIRVLRDGSEIYNGKLAGLRRFKDDVKEVKQGFECGISILNFNDIHEGDIIEAYKMIEEELD